MSAGPREVVTFRSDHPDPVVDLMREVAARRGWITLQPGIDPGDLPPVRSSLFGIFSGHGPEVPVCTWVPNERTRSGVEHVAIGIQHATGIRTAAKLEENGHAVPDRWYVLQDHPKRGLVVAVPPDESHDVVLRWLLTAGAGLSVVPLTGEWRASVFDRH